TWLMVFGSDICANDNETRELAEDLLSIITIFFQERSNETSSRQVEKEGVKRKKKDLQAQCLNT
ncbi:27037_t:CDS:2, partial [Racocetra persica]